MHSFVTSKNVKWCHLIWPTLYMYDSPTLYMYDSLTCLISFPLNGNGKTRKMDINGHGKSWKITFSILYAPCFLCGRCNRLLKQDAVLFALVCLCFLLPWKPICCQRRQHEMVNACKWWMAKAGVTLKPFYFVTFRFRDL